MTKIPDSHVDLLERPILFNLATVQPDGQPQLTPVWGDYKGGVLRINTAAGRQKYKNLVARPQATILVVDPDNDQRYMEIRGRVIEQIEPDNEVIDKLAHDYLGVDKYPYYVDGEVRVTFHIQPERVSTSG